MLSLRCHCFWKCHFYCKVCFDLIKTAFYCSLVLLTKIHTHSHIFSKNVKMSNRNRHMLMWTGHFFHNGVKFHTNMKWLLGLAQMLKLMNHVISNVGWRHTFPPSKIYQKKYWEKVNIDIINWEIFCDRPWSPDLKQCNIPYHKWRFGIIILLIIS